MSLILGLLTAALALAAPGVQAPETPPPAEAKLADALFEIVLTLYEMDSGLNFGIRYVAFDPAGVPEEALAPLTERLRSWAEGLGCELLTDSYQSVVQAGYIGDLNAGDGSGFREGIRFTFRDVAQSEDSVTAFVTKYRGPLGAIGGGFTARFQDGAWLVSEPNPILVS
jgi:hypothetical protein